MAQTTTPTTTLFRATDDTARRARTFWTADPVAAFVWSQQGGGTAVLAATVPMGGDFEPRLQGFEEFGDEWFTTLEAEEVTAEHPGADWVGGWDVHEGNRNRCYLAANDEAADQFLAVTEYTNGEFRNYLEEVGAL